MKKLCIFISLGLVISSLALLGTGCTDKSAETDDQAIIKIVSLLEKQEYLSKTLQISHNDYLKNVEPVLFPNSNYLDKYKSEDIWVQVNNSFNSAIVKKQDILNASKDELKQLRDKLVPPERQTLENSLKLQSIKISKVYPNEAMKGKTVFVTQLGDGYLEGFDVMYYRRYILRKDGEEWKVFDYYPTIIVGYDNPKHATKPKGILQFEEYNNEKVVYDTILNIEELNNN